VPESLSLRPHLNELRMLRSELKQPDAGLQQPRLK
jgi:hypothetical protein